MTHSARNKEKPTKIVPILSLLISNYEKKKERKKMRTSMKD